LSKNSDILFAKQPIYDASNNLYGYEILYRSDEQNFAVIDDGMQATIDLLINYCCGVVEEQTSPYVKVFVNLTRDLLLSECFLPLSPNRVVIEIVESVIVDDDLLVRISELKSMGYVFALDDYSMAPEFDTLLSLVDYIKIAVLNQSPLEITEKYHQLTKNKLKHLSSIPILLAEKVETQMVLEHCQQLGFSLFQGYYLAHPQMVFGKKLDMNNQHALRLVAKLQNDDITVDEIGKMIKQDAQLSYFILKIVNSPACRIPRKVDSIQEGIVYLGLQELKKWTMVLAMTQNSKTPVELIRLLLERAKICELYSEAKRLDSEQAFTLGLFSGLDLVLHADKLWLLEQLGLPSEMINAIVENSGDLGKLLKRVIDIQRGELLAITTELAFSERVSLIAATSSATMWVNEVIPIIRKQN